MQPECLRLNVGVLVTPEVGGRHPSFTTQLSVHPRPGPLSPTPTSDIDIYKVFADYFSPNRRIVSYTAVVPAGQDPSVVCVGWTTAQFHYVASQFQTGASGVYGQKLELVGGYMSHSGSTSSPGHVEYSHSSAYLVCVKQLLTDFTDQNLAVAIRYTRSS